MTLTRTISEGEATALREYVADPTADRHRGFARSDQARLWAPIEVVPATGRAACRACGSVIAKDESCIRFEFDPLGEGHWGHLATAYLHRNECPAKEEER